MKAKMKNWLRPLLLTCVTLLLFSLLAYTFRFQILTGLADFLTVEDKLQPADVIFVLNGDVHTRPFRAAELFKQGLAPQIAIAKEEDMPDVELGISPNGSDVAIGIMKKLGVPDENIVVLASDEDATSTRDEAKTLRDYVDENDIRRVILVTSAFHTRRAQWIFEKELSGSGAILEVAAAPHWKFDETNWWTQEKGVITFFEEFFNLFYYFAVY
jgi:uncharacterized SAM-binding protein YcdF (DUF218 family)